jgi:hypothetical protein
MKTKAEKVLRFAESETLENINTYQKTWETLKSLRLKSAPKKPDDLEVFQKQDDFSKNSSIDVVC